MLNNLKAEMTRNEITVDMMQKVLPRTEKTIRAKINGHSGFSIEEALAIRNAFFPGMDLEYLFARKSSK